MNLGEVTRIAVRFAPMETRANVFNGQFPFDPSKGPGYVWHCHIVDHEDNEMMRPYKVIRQTK
jgi:FtsP/CotA-like multicopper oxidase with cupredoxin domain